MKRISPRTFILDSGTSAAIFLLVVAMVFVVWASRFIYLSSSIAVDGKRYYALFDDAMISMRYAWNFAHGNGLVWNAGEHVEGYTNLLLVLVMAIPNAVLGQRLAVLSIQLFGIVTMLGTAYLTSRIAGLIAPKTGHRTIIRGLSFGAVLLYYPLAYWSLMGMETGLLSLLLLFAFLMVCTYRRTGNPRSAQIMAVTLGLCYLTRPESLLLSGPILSYYFYIAYQARPGHRGATRRSVLVVVALFAILPLAQHLFRGWYYGELFANTYTLKVKGLPLGERIGYGWDYTLPFLKDHALLLVIATIGTVVFFGSQRLLAISIVGIMIAYQIFIGGEPPEWTYWRVVAPIIPLVFALSLGTLAAFYRSKPSGLTLVATGVVGVVAICQPLIRHYDEQTFAIRPYQAQLNAININKALLIDAATTEAASLGVSWGGTIPYYNPQHYAIDYLGKSDPYIAGLTPHPDDLMRQWPGHNKHDLAFSIQTLQPTFSETFSYTWEDVSEWARRRYAALVYNPDTILYFRMNDPAVNFDRALELGLFPWIEWNTDALLDDWISSLEANTRIFMPANSYGIRVPSQVVFGDRLDPETIMRWEHSLQPEPLSAAGVTHLLVDNGWWYSLSDAERQSITDSPYYELVNEWQVGYIFLRLYRISGRPKRFLGNGDVGRCPTPRKGR